MRKLRLFTGGTALAIACLCLASLCGAQNVVKPVKGAKFAYADMVELIAVTDKCAVIRWGLTHNVYEASAEKDKGDNTAKVTIDSSLIPQEGAQPLTGTCDRSTFAEGSQYVFPITGGTQMVLVKSNTGKYRFDSFGIEYGGSYNVKYESKNIDPDLQDETIQEGFMPPLHCFEDLNMYYCLRERTDKWGGKRYFLHRFAVIAAKRQNTDDDNSKAKGVISDIVRVGILELNIPHRGTPALTFYDPFRGELILFYKRFDGHEAYLADVRSLYGLRRRGQLVQYPFEPQDVLGVKSYYGFRYFVVRGSANATDSASTSKTVFSIYASLVGQNAISQLKKFDAKYDEPELQEVDNIGFFINEEYLDKTKDRHALTQISSQLCATLNQVLVDCDAYANSLITYKMVLFIVVGVLTFLFICLAMMLMLYLLCCVKTKRRRRRKKKRKHRKHRKHRPEPEQATQSKAPDEVDVDLDTKNIPKDEKSDKEKSEKKKDNVLVKKLKAFGGVDYSSSSSEEGKVEHSQAYFSAREHFDNKGNNTQTGQTKNTATGTGTVNLDSPYENLAPPPKSTTTDMNQEQEMQDKFVQQYGKPATPRSVYMKPPKKKKK